MLVSQVSQSILYFSVLWNTLCISEITFSLNEVEFIREDFQVCTFVGRCLTTDAIFPMSWTSQVFYFFLSLFH